MQCHAASYPDDLTPSEWILKPIKDAREFTRTEERATMRVVHMNRHRVFGKYTKPSVSRLVCERMQEEVWLSRVSGFDIEV